MTRTGLLLYDLLKGTSVGKTIKFLHQSQYWKTEELTAFQNQKLKKLLDESSKKIPFYLDREALNGEDFRQWPILDRKLVMEEGDNLLSDRINFKKCKISRTGGTTGPPLRLYRDTETRSWALAAYYRFYNWMGIEPGMPEAELWGKTTISGQKSEVSNQKFTQNPKLRTQNFINRFRSYNAFSFNDVYLEAVVADMQKYKPRLIRGYLSAILLLADYIKRNKISGINPLAVSSTAETLFPEYRKKIEEIFQAPLFNQYGCGECNSIAFECKEHKGMHITMEHCVLEQDEENNFIVTNLDNYSQPFIRYKNGDKGSISHESCSCGVASPRITEVRGRANENIILKNGASVNGIFFANLLDQNGFINNDKMLRFQVVQNTAGMIKFKAEVKSPMPDKDEMNLRDSLMPFFHAVDISQHAFLDSGKGGKFRYIVSELNSD